MIKRSFDPADLPEQPDLHFEHELWAAGSWLVAGLDEAGRGAWAGPVAAGAVILPQHPDLVKLLRGVRDSKQMTPLARSFWAEQIKQVALGWGVGFASSQEIDALGIVPATRLAMTRALERLPHPPQHLLIDALPLPALAVPQSILIKGDARSLSIAAASVIAKTARDALMQELDRRYPVYGFGCNKGYGTAGHAATLLNYGPCEVHRFSFAPIRAIHR